MTSTTHQQIIAEDCWSTNPRYLHSTFENHAVCKEFRRNRLVKEAFLEDFSD
ncbi:hypothetical protein M758_3G230600 [Ceratodon purpureus]|uniref:Uncharacterized protein n=1 Tax=Ceratodon purpureus TaxID=3225 RepID=A0A8T0IQ20_CERPU|nr:hypothetical protein KC19_3G229400 [Ceratodon purpureus]KAG0624197.1 hypothetical protein M758_3G230600 [Ceratodon purpureus]